jgi:Amt family ammonium transporter
VLCYFATNWIKNKLKIDDRLVVFPVHGVGGILGTLLACVFCSTQLGIFSGNGFSDGFDGIGGQLTVQATGVLVTFAYTAVVSWVILKLVDAMVGLRVDADEETQGLDLVLHDERGYDLSRINAACVAQLGTGHELGSSSRHYQRHPASCATGATQE